MCICILNKDMIADIKDFTTQKDMEDYPDGTIFKIFLVGKQWNNKWDKELDAIKYNNTLYFFNGWLNIEGIDDPGYEVIAAEVKTED